MQGNKQQFRLPLAGYQLVVNIHYMRRKTMRLVLSAAGEADVRVPLRCPKSEIERFLLKHQDWLLERLDDWHQRKQESHGKLEFLGQTLLLKPSTNKRPLRLGNELQLYAANGVIDQKAAELWLREQARSVFERLIDHWWPQFEQYGKPRPTMRIKKMKTRWGSLSTRGYINLNLALIHLPEELIELVVVHELCHIRHFNHGPGFRALLTAHVTDCRSKEARLAAVKINGFPLTC
ncbi:M48 family metallopeptidase [Oceanobacter mangrovi]|uniref:M48 family metallopeptidase n=1 Tax=Oceanobacter mangrovi TaxID=2862510 RepID=UPI001C8E6878|nr:SprT family zinc-dependent metalloprotease [Oceanobacter mangrovi]